MQTRTQAVELFLKRTVPYLNNIVKENNSKPNYLENTPGSHSLNTQSKTGGVGLAWTTLWTPTSVNLLFCHRLILLLILFILFIIFLLMCIIHVLTRVKTSFYFFDL